MKNLSIKAKLIFGFSVLVLLLIALGTYSHYAAGAIQSKNVELSSAWMPSLKILNEITDNANFTRRAGMMRLLHTTPEKKAEMSKVSAEKAKVIEAKVQEYKDLINRFYSGDSAERAADLAAIGEIEKLWQEYREIGQQVVALDSQGKREEAMTVVTGSSNTKYRELCQAIENRIAYNTEQANKAVEIGVEEYNTIEWSLVACILAALIISISIAYWLIRNIQGSIYELSKASGAVAGGDLTVKVDVSTKDELGILGQEYDQMIKNMRDLIQQIHHTAEQVAASSQQLTASADQSAQVTQQIAQSVTHVSAASDTQVKSVDSATGVIEQISAGVQETSATVQMAVENNKKALTAANQGNETINKTVTQMNFIEETVGKSAAVVTRLGERSKEIGQIVDTISGLAGQTNLLALNAAIEAARAGEQGKGFAVVAEEVRKLAEQSQEAAQRIGELIHVIQTETDAAVAAMSSGTAEVKRGTEFANEAGKDFEVILQMVEVIDKQSGEISVTMEDLAKQSGKIVQAVRAIDTSSQNVAGEAQNVSAATEEQSAAMEQIASSSRCLANLAQDMQKAVQKFKL